MPEELELSATRREITGVTQQLCPQWLLLPREQYECRIHAGFAGLGVVLLFVSAGAVQISL